MPFNLKRAGSNPALVLPHGGPTGQMVDYWNTDVAALVSRGYICIAPNPRGSTGYGLDFQKANFQDLGGGDLKDEIAGVEFLKATGYVDPKRIGITGGSYGGFMTLMAVGKTPDIWAAAVRVFRQKYAADIVSREKIIVEKILLRRLDRTDSAFVQVEIMHTLIIMDRYRYFNSMVPILIQKLDHYNNAVNEVAYAGLNDIIETGLHEFIGGFIADNNALGHAVTEQYLM